jgi:type I restriction enzyme S subunit
MKSTALSDLCDILIGRTPSRNVDEYWGEGHKWVSISDMKEEVIFSTKEQITDKALSSIRCRQISKGTLLLSFKLSVGKLAFAGTDLYTNEAIAALRIRDKSTLDSKFLYYALKKTKFVGGNQAVMGITLNSKSLAELRIPFPPLDDQIRIAAVLTRAEKLIAKRKESIKALDELLKSTFLEMFGPTNKDFLSWPITEMRELAANHKGAMRTGPFGSNLLHSEFTKTGDVAVLGIDNAVQNKFAWDEERFITKEKYTELSSYRIFPGDVIITIMGTIGRSAVIPNDIPLAINTKHLAAITFDKQKANPKFIAYSFHSSPFIKNQLASKNRGAIMNGLNLGLIKETKLRKPPIEIQNQFASILDKVESLKSRYTQSLTALENLYGSLSQRAFKGELDLSRVK